MAQSRFYTSTAQPTVLLSSITPSSTVINVQAVTGFPLSFPYVLALDYGNSAEELVLVTSAVGTSLTVTRAFDGTSGAAHNAGAAVRHTWCGADGNDSRAHEGSVSAVHGVSGTIVGTTDIQVLTNKTLTNPVINSGTLSGTFAGTPQFGTVNFRQTPGTVTALSVRVTGEAADRFQVLANGQISLGGGTVAPDVVLSRASANVLALESGDQLNLLNINAADAGSVGQAFQIGLQSAQNLKASDRVIQSANNGVAAVLDVQPSGGNLRVFNAATSTSSTATLANNGQLAITSPNTGAITHFSINSPVGSSTSASLIDASRGAQARFNVSNNGTVTINTNGAASSNQLSMVADAASTGDIILAQQGANTKFRVDANGNTTIAGNTVGTGTGSFQVETQTTGLVASAGWTVGSFNARRTAGVASIRITMVRSGANITATAAGNISETDVCTIPAGWRTPQASVHSIYANAGSMDGDVNTDTTGLCTISTLSGGATIATGDTMVFNFTYVL